MNTSVYERTPRVAGALSESVAAQSTVESSTSAVSWAAIIAGAFVAAAASVILVALGSGLGFASISPWANRGASATAFAVSAGVWLIVVQWIASALGGYVTGRLRTKWVGTHTHEVFFRDTAHGFVTWAVATVLVVSIVTSAGSSAVGAGSRAVGAAASDAMQAGAAASSTGPAAVGGYDVDMLFRTTRPEAGASAADPRAEATRILARGLTNGDVPAADRAYLAQVVAARTGVSESDAEARVNDVITQVKAAEVRLQQAADAARKAAAASSIFIALSLVIGAFIASVAAALGGRERDEHV